MGDVVAEMSMSLDGFVADRHGTAAAIAATQAAAGDRTVAVDSAAFFAGVADPVRLHEPVSTEGQGVTHLREQVRH